MIPLIMNGSAQAIPQQYGLKAFNFIRIYQLHQIGSGIAKKWGNFYV